MRYNVKEYVTDTGKSPFAEALKTLRDRRAVDKIDTAVRRIEAGNLGDHKGVGAGVIETRIDYAKGYRLYYALDGAELVLLLNAGEKSSQRKDIAAAIAQWKDYKYRKHQ